VSVPFDDLWLPLPAAAGRYRPWLRDPGSLTRRLLTRGRGLQVEVVSQGPRRLHADERFMAGGDVRAVSLARDVLLMCGGQPVVYAHSVIQPGDLGGAYRLMRRIGSRPLGAALFADPRIRRHPLRCRKLGRGHSLYRDAARLLRLLDKAPSAPLWARRSLFVIGKSPILVSEVFLPGLLTL
jgi:chorismate--pyruvate lyase